MNNQDLEQQINTAIIGFSGKDVKQDQPEKSFRPGPCILSMLPVELQIRIFMLFVNNHESNLASLTSICRFWRTIILTTRTFWHCFIISDKTTREKVETWLQRAGGTFPSLLFKEFFDFDTLPGLLGNASASIWPSLEHLEIRSKQRYATLLPPTVYKELRLRSLVLFISCPSPKLWDDVWIIDVSRMQYFQLQTSLDLIPIAGSRFTGLVTLRLGGIAEESALLTVSERNPMLESLGLYGIRQELGSSRRVQLVNLTELEFSANACVDEYLRCLIFPKLKVLHLLCCSLESSEAVLANTFTHLEKLSLNFSKFLAPALIILLRNAPALRKLEFTDFGYDALSRGDTNSVFEALASHIPGESEGTPRTLCCPRLQHVLLSGDPEITIESAMGLVKARLLGIGSAANLGVSTVKPLLILCLRLEDCRSVARESLPWFEANVPKFIYR